MAGKSIKEGAKPAEKWGGKRPGAGRKPKAAPKDAQVPPPAAPEAPVDVGSLNMLELLEAVALGKVMATNLQVRAAIAAVQYTHTKRHDGGKKEERADATKKAAGGRFASAPAPKLVVSNR